MDIGNGVFARGSFHVLTTTADPAKIRQRSVGQTGPTGLSLLLLPSRLKRILLFIGSSLADSSCLSGDTHQLVI